MSVASSSLAAARGAGRTVDQLLERPRVVLGTLIGVQIAATIVLALTVTHNGWVYFQGGDQIVNTTTGWLLTTFTLPPTEIGYIWPLVQAPITLVTGPTFVQVLPVLLPLSVLALGPVALLCVYGIASSIGGRLLGYWASTLWVIAPFAVIPLFEERYHEKWVDHFLPQALGLTAMPDYPSMVLVLAAAYFVVRSLTPGNITDALLAGLLAGAAGGLKPANYLFVFGAALAYPVARRWLEVAGFGIALAPSLLALYLWKDRGLGYVPALTLEQAQLAAGSGAAFLDINLDRYVDLDLDHWREQMGQLREYFWSARLAQWAPFAGLLAVLRLRRWGIAALLTGWLGAFIVVKGFSERASIEANTFWRLLMPAWPAYLLLLAAIPMLVPTLASRLGARVSPPRGRPVRMRWIGVTAVLTIAVPVAATAASEQLQPPSPDAIVQSTPTATTILTPVDTGIELETEPSAAGRRLTWSAGSDWRANVFYRVYRMDDAASDLQCVTRAEAAWECYLVGQPIATTREREYVDPEAPPGAIYRIGVGTNWVDDPEEGDIFVVSPPKRAIR